MQVESFVFGEGEEEVVVADLNKQFLLTAAAAAAAASGGGSGAAPAGAGDLVVGLEAAVGVGDSPLHQATHFDPETQARLVALLEAAGQSVL